MPMRAAPIPIITAHIRLAPCLPHLSMTRLATRLPARPPTVNMEVRMEKVTSDMGIQSTKMREKVVARRGSGAMDLHVKTAWI